MKLDIPQIVELTMTRNRTGYHIFHEADGESTTNGYIFGLPSHPAGGYAEIALAVEFAPGFKTNLLSQFEIKEPAFPAIRMAVLASIRCTRRLSILFDLRYDYHLGGNHIRYTIPRSATDKTAIVTQQFNLKDKPVEVPVKDVKVRPGMHVVRIRIDDRSSNTQFYVDEDKLIDGGILNVENANLVSIKTEKGRVFEAHFVAETDGDVFPAVSTHLCLLV
ncbi:hypothetical protein HPB50_011138 [Hyalomma asiaticum]|uniref:Uncharacterized protein n=1 Tax=Hyalomma asiaticum TaxID=266040 RepID=A0ACB7T7V1_HYAAI|nr:hypothetical protein HPB50_011138 [Hyalomma asiaticum]